METSKDFIKFATVLLVLLLNCLQIQGLCNVCQENGVACINATSYHLCFGTSQPHTEQVFTCHEGLMCTNLPNICFQVGTRPASCEDTSICGVCDKRSSFACTSRTTFAFCFGANKPSEMGGACPVGMVCDASTENICVDYVQPTSLICHLEAPPQSIGN